jgi:hypothetical protein
MPTLILRRREITERGVATALVVEGEVIEERGAGRSVGLEVLSVHAVGLE